MIQKALTLLALILGMPCLAMNELNKDNIHLKALIALKERDLQLAKERHTAQGTASQRYAKEIDASLQQYKALLIKEQAEYDAQMAQLQTHWQAQVDLLATRSLQPESKAPRSVWETLAKDSIQKSIASIIERDRQSIADSTQAEITQLVATIENAKKTRIQVITEHEQRIKNLLQENETQQLEHNKQLQILQWAKRGHDCARAQLLGDSFLEIGSTQEITNLKATTNSLITDIHAAHATENNLCHLMNTLQKSLQQKEVTATDIPQTTTTQSICDQQTIERAYYTIEKK